MSGNAPGNDGRKHVVIVGAGAAGMSCAAALAEHPTRFRVTMLEAAGNCGGQATSISIDKEKHGAGWMNDGVQGGSPIFRHTMRFFEQYGHKAQEVSLQVGFGKGPESFWTNVFPSPLVEQHQKDIKRFGTMLTWIKRLMPILGLIPIRIMLRLFRFSDAFGIQMVYPLIALFLGTGNQTPNVACAILERLFDDPNMKLWDYDPDTLLPNLPKMITFPKLADFYADWEKDLRGKGVDIRLNTAVDTVVRRGGAGGVVLRVRGWDPAPNNDGGQATTPATETEAFDELVLCTLADEAKRILGKQASWRERFVLGGAKFYDDMTVTHWDRAYFDAVYETTYADERCAAPQNAQQQQQVKFARGDEKGPGGEAPGYRPMYFTHTYAEAPGKIEMSFDVTHYQHQFRGGSDGVPAGAVPAWDQHVFQSIFLDVNHRHLWTQDQIAGDKIIAHKWWHQLGHRWQHYLRVVPLMPLLQGRRHTFFAGSWNLVNMHELACVSGLAVAHRLGAEYTYFDDFAEDFFGKYLLLNHWAWYTPKSKGKKNA